MLMVVAGKVTDQVIDQVSFQLVVIDHLAIRRFRLCFPRATSSLTEATANFKVLFVTRTHRSDDDGCADTNRRTAALSAKGLLYIGTGHYCASHSCAHFCLPRS